MGPSKHHAHVIPSAFFGYRCLAHPLGNGGKFTHRKDVETALLTLGYDKALRQLISEAGGQDKATLLIELRLVGP